jgi:hypothetical protein
MEEPKPVETEVTDTQDKILSELGGKNVKPSDISIDWQKTAEIAKEQAKTEQTIALTDAVEITLPSQFKDLGKVMTSAEALRSIEDRIFRLRAEQKRSWFTNWIYSGVQAIVYFLQDFWLIGQYASIQGEPTRLQPLRKTVRPTLMDMNRALEYYKRNPDYKSELWETLQRQGIKDTDIERLVELNEAIPGPQDIVSWLVREVYDEAVVREFEQDKGFERLYDQAKKDADRAGIPKDTLRKFWMAHWRLPGIMQGFDMLHRKVINVDQLRTLLRTSDIMPGFIEPLIKISYRPLTRVDIRRIAKLLKKEPDWIKLQYEKLGYNDEDSGTMRDFTIEYNKDKPDNEKTDKDKQKDLTRTDVLKAYDMDLMDKSSVHQALYSLGYDKDEAEVYTDRVEWQKELELINGYVSAFKKAYVQRLWDSTETLQQLNKLNLPHQYIEYLMEIWTIQREIKDKVPSKAEILSFMTSNIIGEPQARQELSDLGYADKYIDMYVKAAWQRSKK